MVKHYKIQDNINPRSGTNRTQQHYRTQIISHTYAFKKYISNFQYFSENIIVYKSHNIRLQSVREPPSLDLMKFITSVHRWRFLSYKDNSNHLHVSNAVAPFLMRYVSRNTWVAQIDLLESHRNSIRSIWTWPDAFILKGCEKNSASNFAKVLKEQLNLHIQGNEKCCIFRKSLFPVFSSFSLGKYWRFSGKKWKD